MTDRCREKRTAALRRLIEDAEARGISECSVEEVFAEASALSDERGRHQNAAAGVRNGVRQATSRKG